MFDRKEYQRQWRKESRYNNRKSWEGFIHKKTKCQICSKTIYFNQKEKGINNTINFDHKEEAILIKEPTHWLDAHFCTLKNQKIWKSCNFGILCGKCNRALLTENREQFIKNAVKYVLKGYRLCKI